MNFKIIAFLSVALSCVATSYPLRAQQLSVGAGQTVNITTATNVSSFGVGGLDGDEATLNIISPGSLTVLNDPSIIGFGNNSNEVNVIGAGASWTNYPFLYIGYFGQDNQVSVTDGGSFVSREVTLGLFEGSSNNKVLVAGSGSQWSGDNVYLGAYGNHNQLLVQSDGEVNMAGIVVGLEDSSVDNLVRVENARLTATDGILIQRGLLQFEGGTVTVGLLRATNGPSSQFLFNSGGLVTGQTEIDNGRDFLVGEDNGIGAGWIVNGNLRDSKVAQGLDIGVNVPFSYLWVTNGSRLSIGASTHNPDISSRIGVNNTVLNNEVFVEGAGSVWTNIADLHVGHSGNQSNKRILNGGRVDNQWAYVGFNDPAYSSQVDVSGPDSLWKSEGRLYFGYRSPANNMLISDGGRVENQAGYVGSFDTSDGNVAEVTGADSLWWSDGNFFLGEDGDRNQLILSSNGTKKVTFTTFVGNSSNGTSNHITLNGGNLINTNSAGTGTLDIRYGAVTMNSGSIDADRFRQVTDPVGVFAFNGGLLSTKELTVDNGSPFIVGLSPGVEPATWIAHGNGLTHEIVGELHIGSEASGTGLVVTNGSVVTNTANFTLGIDASSRTNYATVTGGESKLANGENVRIGGSGPQNRLEISNGGRVTSVFSVALGIDASSSSNQIIVSDEGSQLLPGTQLRIGNRGAGNFLLLTNGASIRNPQTGYLGYFQSSSDNLAMVTGSGSSWTNSTDLVIGREGANNELRLLSGGRVTSGANTILGELNNSTNNLLHLDGGELSIGANLDVRRGTLQLDGGTVIINSLIATNGTDSEIIFNGGTLITESALIDNGLYFNVGSGSGSSPAQWIAQGSLQTNSINGRLSIGDNVPNASLLITNGAIVKNTIGYLGGASFSSNNTAIVHGLGSLWESSDTLWIGNLGSGNLVIITNGGAVRNTDGILGAFISSSNNTVLVDGQDSIWDNLDELNIGIHGSGNHLIITNGATVKNGLGVLGTFLSSSNNTAVVDGAGSTWDIGSDLRIGNEGSGNQLVIDNDGEVKAADNLIVGRFEESDHNFLHLKGGHLTVGKQLDVRRGTLQLDGGEATVKTLVATNGTDSEIIFNGGTLSLTGSTVANDTSMVVGNGTSPALLLLRSMGEHSFDTGLTIADRGILEIVFGTQASIRGPLTTESGSVLVFSNPGGGSLTLSNSPSLNGETIVLYAKQSGTTDERLTVLAPLTYGGSLSVNKVDAEPLVSGDVISLFGATSYDGAFSSVSLPSLESGLMWTNKLLIDGSIAVIEQTVPAISTVIQSGTNVVFNISGGSPGGAYDLLTTTNVTLPLNEWMTNSSGSFDWMGNLSVTNEINPADPERYFSISVQ